MATSANRDVKMTLSVETLGADEVKKLQSTVAGLAKEGGDAAPEFQKLADEIGRLGEQSAALQAFQQLSGVTAELAARQEQAAQASSDLGSKLQAAEKDAKAAAASQGLVAAALTEARDASSKTRDALARLIGQTAEAKKADESYGQTVSDLRLKKVEQRAEIERLTASMEEADTQVTQAEAAQKKLAASYAFAAREAKSAEAALRENQSGTSAAANAAELLWVSTGNVAAAQAELVQSLNQAGKAAQTMQERVDALAARERELEGIRAFEKQYQEARKLEQAAQYVKELTQELDRVELAANEAADAAKQSGDKISNAFKTVGVRSAEELRAEISQVRAAMQTLQAASSQTGAALDGAFNAGNARIKELERDIREVSGTLTMADKAAGLFKNSMWQITAGNIVADGVGYLVNKVKELGAAFLGAIVDGDQMRRGLNAIYKDAAVTASQIEFLRKSSSESGVAFGALSGEFVKFSASMKLANVPLEQSNNLFNAVTAASASLGLGSEATAGALNALGQMASKGTVSLEELRQQLGDRLPGAMGLTAKGLGITEAQLIKLVESGGLATRDFIVPFTRALEGLKGEIDGLVPAFDRFKGTLSEMSQGVGDAGGVTLLTGALKLLGGVAGTVALGLSQMMEGLFLMGAATVAFYQQLKGDAGAWDFFNQQVAASSSRLDKQKESLLNFIAPSEAAAASTKGHAAALTQNTAEVVKSINANASLSAEQKLASLSTALAGDATLDASAKMVQYNVAAAELIKKQEGQTEAYAKSAKAAKEQGDTLVALAKLTGDATEIQNASTQAAELHSAALDKVAASQASETVMLVAQKAELLASAATRKLSAEDIRAEAEALDNKITKSQAETEQARQSALAQKAELFERQLATAALKDHSAEVGKFKTAMNEAAATLKNYELLSVNGKKTDEEVAAARRALVTATVLYRDALTDLISKTELETRAKTANLQLASAQAKAGADHSLALAAEARSRGDTATAIYYEIKAREQNIAVLKLEIEIRDLEAKAALATIELKRKSIDAMTDEGKKKLEILDIEKKLIDIKLIASGATKDAITVLEREIDALRNGVDLRGKSKGAIDAETGSRYTNVTAIDRQTSALEAQNTAQERANAAIEKAIALEDKRLNRDKEGFSLDTGGRRVNMDVQNQRSVYENARSQGLDEAQALQISRQFIDSLGRQIGGAQANSAKGENWGTELQKAIDKQVLRNAGSKATSTFAEPKVSQPPLDSATANAATTDTSALISDYQQQLNAATARGDTGDIAELKAEIARLKAGNGGTPIGTPLTTTVNINLNSTTQRVNTDADGARVLQEVLSQLGNARSTSSR